MGIIAGNGKENIISKDNVAIERDFILGHEYGVIRGFEATIKEGTQGANAVEIKEGQLFAYGYAAMLPYAITLSYLLPSITQYWFIYGELNMSHVPNTFTIKTKNNGASQKATWRQDVLSSIRTGVFEIPLWRVTITSTGISQLESAFKYSNHIKNVIYADEAKICTGRVADVSYYNDVYNGIEGGSTFGGNELVAREYTFDRRTGKYSLVGEIVRLNTLAVGETCYHIDSDDNTNMEQDLIESIEDGDISVAWGIHTSVAIPVIATTQLITDNSTKVATTEFVQSLFSSNIQRINLTLDNIIKDAADIPVAEGWIGRKYDFAIGRFYLPRYRLQNNGQPIAHIPEGFRPAKEIIQIAGYSLATLPSTSVTITIKTNGDIYTSGTSAGFYIAVNFGYKIGG